MIAIHRTAAAAAAAVLLAVAVPAAGAATASGTCTPGSGKQLAGRTLTSADVSAQTTELRCANLTGATLSGLSLVQADLTGAILRNASLQHTDLTQATLDQADLAHANLSGATLDQVTAHAADFQSANLSGASLTQADLTGASLNGADLNNTDFTQATLDRTTFRGATGLFPWATVLLIATMVLFLMLALPAVIMRVRQGGRRRRPLAAVLAGSLVAAAGFHLFFGGLISEFVGGFGSPVVQTCQGPLCSVGVGSGFFGLFGGVFAVLIGLAIRRLPGRGKAAAAMPPPARTGSYF